MRRWRKVLAALEREPTPDRAGAAPLGFSCGRGSPSLRSTKKACTGKTCARFFGSPTGTRTPVFAVRGRRLNRLTMRPYLKLLDDYSIKREGWQADFAVFFKKIKKIQRRGNGQKMHAECASVYLCNMCRLTFTAQGKFTELRSTRGDMRRTAQERAHSPCCAEK